MAGGNNKRKITASEDSLSPSKRPKSHNEFQHRTRSKSGSQLPNEDSLSPSTVSPTSVLIEPARKISDTERPKSHNEFHHRKPSKSGSQLPNGDPLSHSPVSVHGSPASVLIEPACKISDIGNSAKKIGFGLSKGNKAIRAILDMNNEEYILKLTSVPTENAEAEQARTAAVLLSQGEILCKLGQELLSKIGASYESWIYKRFNMEAMLN